MFVFNSRSFLFYGDWILNHSMKGLTDWLWNWRNDFQCRFSEFLGDTRPRGYYEHISVHGHKGSTRRSSPNDRLKLPTRCWKWKSAVTMNLSNTETVNKGTLRTCYCVLMRMYWVFHMFYGSFRWRLILCFFLGVYIFIRFHVQRKAKMAKLQSAHDIMEVDE